MVEVGFTPPDVTQMLPSTMNRFLHVVAAAPFVHHRALGN